MLVTCMKCGTLKVDLIPHADVSDHYLYCFGCKQSHTSYNLSANPSGIVTIPEQSAPKRRTKRHPVTSFTFD